MKRPMVCLLAFALLSANPAWGGTGTYVAVAGGPDEIHLKVNLHFSNPKASDWEPLFVDAARLLFDATEKQIRIASVTFFGKCPMLANDSDIFIFGGQSDASSDIGQLGNSGFAIRLSHLHKINSQNVRGYFGLVHELGHYVFGLLEEYKSKGGVSAGVAECVSEKAGAAHKTASIMDGGTTIPLKNLRTEFCIKENHSTGLTEQDQLRKIDGAPFEDKDGWTWIEAYMRYRYGADLDLPISEPVASTAEFSKPKFSEAKCELRTKVGIRGSEKISALPQSTHEAARGDGRLPIEAAKDGAAMFIRLLDGDDAAGLVKMGEDIVGRPMHLMGVDNKFRLLTEISGIRMGEPASWPDLLKEAFTQMTEDEVEEGAAGGPGGEVILLLSDGRQKAQDESVAAESLESVLLPIKRRGAVVYAISMGGHDAAGLRRTATETGGNYITAKTAAEISAAVLTFSAQIKSRGVIVAQEGSLQANESRAIKVPVDLATSKEGINFILSWSGLGGLAMELRNPDDNRVTALDPDVGLLVGLEQRLTRYWVGSPGAGEWRVILTNQGTSRQDFAFQAHSLAPGVSAAANAEKAVVAHAAPLILRAVVRAGYPVHGAKVVAKIQGPRGGESTVELYDDGSVSHGDDRQADGIYSNIFDDTHNSGSYNVEVLADSTDFGHTVAAVEQGGSFQSERVPRFVRTMRFSIVVQDPAE